MKFLIILLFFILTSCGISLNNTSNDVLFHGQIDGKVLNNQKVLEMKKITKEEVISIINNFEYKKKDFEKIKKDFDRKDFDRKDNISLTLSECETFIKSYNGINNLNNNNSLYHFAKTNKGIVDRKQIEILTGDIYNYEVYLSYLYLLGKINKEEYLKNMTRFLDVYNYSNIFKSTLIDDYDDQFMHIKVLIDIVLGNINKNKTNTDKYCKGVFLKVIN